MPAKGSEQLVNAPAPLCADLQCQNKSILLIRNAKKHASIHTELGLAGAYIKVSVCRIFDIFQAGFNLHGVEVNNWQASRSRAS